MKEKKREVVFSVLLVVVSGFVFFCFGMLAAARFGFAQPKTVIEYVASETTVSYTNPTDGYLVVNLNTATAEDLMRIEGIGEKTARNILQRREELGGFSFLEQLLDVDNIGEKKLEIWRPYLTVGETGNTKPAATALGKINLNTATMAELMRIDGIGEKTAQKIIQYREEHGRFTSLEQLKEIENIGDKKLAAWRPYLTIE